MGEDALSTRNESELFRLTGRLEKENGQKEDCEESARRTSEPSIVGTKLKIARASVTAL